MRKKNQENIFFAKFLPSKEPFVKFSVGFKRNRKPFDVVFATVLDVEYVGQRATDRAGPAISGGGHRVYLIVQDTPVQQHAANRVIFM